MSTNANSVRIQELQSPDESNYFPINTLDCVTTVLFNRVDVNGLVNYGLNGFFMSPGQNKLG